MGDRATREAFGATLIELANEGVDIVAVDADLSGSTTTAKFADAYPERFFNVGIAEQTQAACAELSKVIEELDAAAGEEVRNG